MLSSGRSKTLSHKFWHLPVRMLTYLTRSFSLRSNCALRHAVHSPSCFASLVIQCAPLPYASLSRLHSHGTLVVIAIIGILSSVVLASLNGARKKGRDARRISDLKQIQLALEMYSFEFKRISRRSVLARLDVHFNPPRPIRKEARTSTTTSPAHQLPARFRAASAPATCSVPRSKMMRTAPFERYRRHRRKRQLR